MQLRRLRRPASCTSPPSSSSHLSCEHPSPVSSQRHPCVEGTALRCVFPREACKPVDAAPGALGEPLLGWCLHRRRHRWTHQQRGSRVLWPCTWHRGFQWTALGQPHCRMGRGKLPPAIRMPWTGWRGLEWEPMPCLGTATRRCSAAASRVHSLWLLAADAACSLYQSRSRSRFGCSSLSASSRHRGWQRFRVVGEI